MSYKSRTTAQASTASDFEAVSQQLAALRKDMSRLADTVTGIAGRRGSHVADDIAEGYGEARQYVEKTGKSAEHQLEASIAAHPLLAIGLAAGAGFVVGAMSWR